MYETHQVCVHSFHILLVVASLLKTPKNSIHIISNMCDAGPQYLVIKRVDVASDLL